MRILVLFFITFISLYGAKIYKNGAFVIDKTNNLLWQDSKANIIMLGSQEQAIEYCTKLTSGGYSSWRLPTKDEYNSIIDKTRKDEIMLNHAFKYVIKEGYWTSTTRWQNFWRYGYYFFVKSGNLYYENKTYPKFFRCVKEIN